jgi:PEGA domain
VLSSPDRQALGPELLANAQARQRALAATPAVLNVTTTPPGAHVRVSGIDLVAPTPLTLRLGPGRHLIQVSMDGYQSQQLEIVASPGAKLAPAFTLVPTGTGAAGPTLSAPPIAPLPEPSSVVRSRVPGYVTLGLAGASAVVGTIFGVKALGDKQDFDDAPSTAGADDVERNALIADMAFGVALTLGITGVVLLVADDPLPEQASQGHSLDQASLRVLPYVSPTGAGASASLTF